MNSTMPSPVIDIGSLAANPAAVNARASGVPSTCRYAPNPAAMPLSCRRRLAAVRQDHAVSESTAPASGTARAPPLTGRQRASSDVSLRTTRCCCCPSVGPSVPRTWCRSWRTSPGVAAFPASGWPRWASTTSCSAAGARSTTSAATLLAALRTELDRRGVELPLFWGNRNWEPYLGDVAGQLQAAGHRRVLVLTTSAYPSYSSCRQYRENLYDAFADTGIVVERIRHAADHPGFVAASVDATVAAVDGLLAEHGAAIRPRLVFVTHSIPTAMAETAGPQPRSAEGAYVDWHRRVAAEVTRRVAAVRGVADDHDLVYCSRSGPPTPALAGAGRQRPSDRPRRGGRERGRHGADRLRVRPHGGHLRPRHRGGGHGA